MLQLDIGVSDGVNLNESQSQGVKSSFINYFKKGSNKFQLANNIYNKNIKYINSTSEGEINSHPLHIGSIGQKRT